jgi:hypothetical protein
MMNNRSKYVVHCINQVYIAGLENDVNYDGSVKAFAFLLNNYCNVSMDKTREFLSELTGGALQISKGMICGLGKEFSENLRHSTKHS